MSGSPCALSYKKPCSAIAGLYGQSNVLLDGAVRVASLQWHLDRFINDDPKSAEADMRMSQINVAYPVICEARGGNGRRVAALGRLGSNHLHDGVITRP